MTQQASEGDLVREALSMLDVQHLLLAIHDQSFPCLEQEDIGRGSPYSEGARDFLKTLSELGFSGVQLGPQGQTSRPNPSPYDGCIFGKCALSIAPATLTQIWPELAIPELASWTERAHGRSNRVDYGLAWEATDAISAQLWRQVRGSPGLPSAGRQSAVLADYEQYLQREAADDGWLSRLQDYAALSSVNRSDDWRLWNQGDRQLYSDPESAAARLRQVRRQAAEARDLLGFQQFLLAAQHRHLRSLARDLKLSLFGDLQVGLSFQDQWAWQALFLDGYRIGAPPSRTNPEGQPWGYPVLDPRLIAPGRFGRPDAPAPALDFLRRRADAMFGDFDGVRIDHPHGLIYPWVYHSETGDDFHAVRSGARLYASPDLPDHPQLAQFSLVSGEQLERKLPRHADGWVRQLTEEQTREFSLPLRTIVEAAKAHQQPMSHVACEVLSTWPSPLRAAMEQSGMGRFCVTQKADPNDAHDVYRATNTAPPDWIMLGNHDTESVWSVISGWQGTAALGPRAHYLAALLQPDATQRPQFAQALESDQGCMAEAMLAELFVAPARHVSIFWVDLLGSCDRYNRPGIVSDDNWVARVPSDWHETYLKQRAHRRAANLPRALALALDAKIDSPEARTLAARLRAATPLAQ